MRYAQLRAFHHVALTGGFSRAAEALHLTQPAISEQVRKLEQEHDVHLIDRDRKQVHLTEAGLDLFVLTKQFFEIEAQIGEHLTQTAASVAGELRIIADAAHHITPVLSAYRRRFPAVTVTLRVGNTEDILGALRSYDAEIGVVGGLPAEHDMEALDLGRSNLIAFAADGVLDDRIDALPLADLAKWPLIFREPGSKTRQKLEDEGRRLGLQLTPAIVATGREAVREVVASGAGIGFVSRAEYVDDPRVRPIAIAGSEMVMRETLVHLAQRRDVRLIRSFMDVTRAVISG